MSCPSDIREAVSRNFAGCIAWEQWVKLPEINRWVSREEAQKEAPEIGDIVPFDRVFRDEEHGHIAVITDVYKDTIETAAGNFNNMSAIVKRPYDNARGYIRLEP